MKTPLEDFDFSALNDPEFKEDAVREEIITPLLKGLGYSSTGSNKIVRSRPLEHPFVSIGTTQHKINIIPDYLLYVNNKPGWILDAKRPSENIREGKNVEQAYSYAMHREVRTQLYALCNGHHLTAFHVFQSEPILDISIRELSKHWTKVVRLLNPTYLAKPHLLDFNPDFGLHLLRLGFIDTETTLHFVKVPTFQLARIEESLYTLGATIEDEGQKYMVSFDFDQSLLNQLLSAASTEQKVQIKAGLSRAPFVVEMETNPVLINIKARLGNTVNQNEDEEYLPLIVEQFSE